MSISLSLQARIFASYETMGPAVATLALLAGLYESMREPAKVQACRRPFVDIPPEHREQVLANAHASREAAIAEAQTRLSEAGIDPLRSPLAYRES